MKKNILCSALLMPFALSCGEKHGEAPRTADFEQSQLTPAAGEPANRDETSTVFQRKSTGTQQDPAAAPAQTPDADIVVLSIYDYIGTPVQGVLPVNEVISPRAFWLGSDSSRVLAVIRGEVPRDEMKNITVGQQLRFTGLVMPKEDVDQLTGALSQNIRDAIQNEPAFIAMHWSDVSIASGETQRGETNPGAVQPDPDSNQRQEGSGGSLRGGIHGDIPQHDAQPENIDPAEAEPESIRDIQPEDLAPFDEPDVGPLE